MEEPLFLVAVERQIGGIEIGHDLPGWLGESFEEQVDQELIERVRVAVDLFVASRFGGAQFEAIQGAFAGQGLLGLAFTGEEAEEGIVAPLVVIVEIFVAEGEAVDALSEQLLDGVLDVARIAVIVEAGGEAGQEVEFGAVWRRRRAPPSEVVAGPLKSATTGRPWCAAKGNSDWVHSVIAKAVPCWTVTACLETQFCHRERLFASDL